MPENTESIISRYADEMTSATYITDPAILSEVCLYHSE